MDEEKVTPTPAEEPVEGIPTEDTVSFAEGTAVQPTAPAPKKQNVFDKFFGITASGSSFKAEIVAGLTTFMAMVYIMIVNPAMFANIPGVSFQGMYIATALGAIVGTLLMALLAKMPLAQASGMGVNAFVVFNLVIYGGLTYANAMVFTLLDGIIFLILTVTGVRKYIFKAIPDEVRKAINVGLGLFIAFIGLQNAGVIVANSSTLVNLASFNVLSANFVTYASGTVGGMLPAIVAILGVITIAILEKKKVKGSILFGIIGSAVLFYVFAGFACLAGGSELISYTFKGSEITGIDLSGVSAFITQTQGVVEGTPETFYAVSNMPVDLFEKTFNEIPRLASHFYTNGLAAKQIFTSISFSNPFAAFGAWGTESAGKVFYEGFNFGGYLGVEGNTPASLVLLLVTSALSLCMLDMFDTLGTLYGACSKGNLLDKEGNPLNMNKCMLSDAIATCTGAIAGTSTVTTFVESSAGVAAGGKTGFAALITAAGFFVAMFLSPIAQLIPSAATATALIWVGVLMMSTVVNIEWTDPAVALPAFLTIAVMAFGYEISYGIGIGIISSVIVRVCTGRIKSVSVVTWVLAAFFFATFILTH